MLKQAWHFSRLSLYLKEYKMRLGYAQASLAFLSAFIIFKEYKMRLGYAQASLAFLSAFVIFAANIRYLLVMGYGLFDFLRLPTARG
jgi:hypothetical protein